MNQEKGTVVQITPLQVLSEKFRKQKFTIKTFDENYPQFVTFQVVNDKCDLVANLNTGDVVEVNYNLRIVTGNHRKASPSISTRSKLGQSN